MRLKPTGVQEGLDQVDGNIIGYVVRFGFWFASYGD
jgi:hypothetical protein